MNLYDWLDERKNLKDEIVEFEVTVMRYGLAKKEDRERLEYLKKMLAQAEKKINDLTR